MMNTRLAEKKDCDKLVLLFDAYRVFYEQPSNLEESTKFLNDRFTNKDSIIIVAEEDGELIGFTQLYPLFSSVTVERMYLLNDLYVEKDQRRKGVGKVLLDAAKQVATDHKVKGLALSTAKDNPARYLYEEEGWEKDDEFLYYFWKNDASSKS